MLYESAHHQNHSFICSSLTQTCMQRHNVENKRLESRDESRRHGITAETEERSTEKRKKNKKRCAELYLSLGPSVKFSTVCSESFL